MAKKLTFDERALAAMANELEQAEQAVRNMRVMYDALVKQRSKR
ncbi:hypothetical protein SAMN05216338_104664 [Bradyrhizobium sp. Rc2d]|nr:hypothetical protein [Bradyrhizobium sp. Rc2d]SDJ34051.1 hypothetical protein SAMN05216338_104664 [Bradyrhizobium sp. Rc2d]